jgi:hypothetical protein
MATEPQADAESVDPRHRLVTRCIRRYDILMSAHRAEVAMRINRVGYDTTIFDADDLMLRAATTHLQEGSKDEPNVRDDAARIESLNHAAALAEIARMLGLSDARWFDPSAVRGVAMAQEHCDFGWMGAEERAPTAAELYKHSLSILGHFASSDLADTSEVEFMELRVATYWSYVRGLRIGSRRSSGWLAESMEVDEDAFFAGTGLEHYRLHFECERLAELCKPKDTTALQKYLDSGRASQAAAVARESWWRGRLQLIEAFASYLTGRIDRRALLQALTDTVPDHLPDTVSDLLRSRARESPDYLIHELNAALCAMDVAHVGGGQSGDDVVYRLAKQAVDRVEEIFRRWRLLARSQSPLAAALRACLGDVAEVCATRTGDVNELGFRVSTLIKQNTLSHILQNPTIALPQHIQNHLMEISGIDQDLWNPQVSTQLKYKLQEQRDAAREGLERRIQARFHLLSLDLLDPAEVDTAKTISSLGGRPALDFVWIESTGNPTLKSWFRTFIDASGNIEFSRQSDDFSSDLVSKVAMGTAIPERPLADLSAALLPCQLDGTDPGEGVAELIVSPHGTLDLVPWAALRPHTDGPRLVENYSVVLSPCLANLSAERPSEISEPALVHLVAKEHTKDGKVVGQRLKLSAEFESWGRHYEDEFDDVLSFESITDRPVPDKDLKRALRERATSFGFLHLAAHGEGSGLSQAIHLPEPFTAAEAFGLSWPPAVLLAVCHSGEINVRKFTEPLAFCIAVLAGGAGAVAAGIGQVSDAGAGFIASRIVEHVRSGPSHPLPELLRQAQLEAIRYNLPSWQWARFVTYVR